MEKILWDQKRYHSLDYELKKIYGKKIYKLSLDGGMTCPNRDGALDTRGCIFCSEGGSGDFAAKPKVSISDQIREAKKQVASKLVNPEAAGYIAYFQAYTNTYAPIGQLRTLFTDAASQPEIVLLSIATRPDCISDETILLLKEIAHSKPVWIELGLQTMHDKTAAFIRRGYPLEVFENCVRRLEEAGIPVIVHTILGLPGETPDDIRRTMIYLSHLPIQGIKLQLLHILKGTDLGYLYEQGKVPEPMTLEEYVRMVISCLELLPGDMVIHRVTGDGPRKLLLAPLWSTNKKLVLNRIQQVMKNEDTWQGKYFESP
jgi:radical SAM protein (TIGR01212 family)